MNLPQHGIEWLADATVRDLIQRFPLPIAVLDDAGSVLVANDRFERTYGSVAIASAPLQALIRKPVPGWQTVQVPGREPGQIAIRAQVLRVEGNPILIIDDATDPDLLRELD